MNDHDRLGPSFIRSIGSGLPSGTEVWVAVGVEGDSTPLYAFRSDDTSAMPPEKIILRVGNGEPFVNTSVRFLDGSDYLYDFDGGCVAFRGLA